MWIGHALVLMSNQRLYQLIITPLNRGEALAEVNLQTFASQWHMAGYTCYTGADQGFRKSLVDGD